MMPADSEFYYKEEKLAYALQKKNPNHTHATFTFPTYYQIRPFSPTITCILGKGLSVKSLAWVKRRKTLASNNLTTPKLFLITPSTFTHFSLVLKTRLSPSSPSSISSSMADAAPKTKTNPLFPDHANPSRFFLYKAALVTVLLVLLPLFPSVAPDFVNQTRSWELLQIIFVGIAVSYGLFSKRNDDEAHKDNAKADNAQSYVSKLLQVSSVFDDELDNQTVIEENKFQALNSQYYRGEPVVHVVRKKKENHDSVEEANGVVSQISSQKPLLLPVRSLKQRVDSDEEVDRSEESDRVNSKKLGSRFLGGLNVEEENVVLRSPIPWRSRSGRIEMKEDSDYEQTPLISDEQESNRRIESSRSFSRQSKGGGGGGGGGEDTVRKKNFSSPPPAPPPPPSPALLRKSSSSVGSNAGSTRKLLSRSVRSMPIEELIENEMDEVPRRNNLAAELRVGTIFKLNELEMAAEKESNEFVESSDEGEVESEDDLFDDSMVGSSSGNAASGGDNGGDVGPDVDKKADEFIAKFREQIRLQRIESIRKTTAQRAGKR